MAGERPSERYQLVARIGGGGMAEVFEAALVGAEGFVRPVALKRIQPSFSSDPKFGRMFVNEARIASLLHHANIAAVIDFDRDEEGRYFLVMELIRGVDLRRLMDTDVIPTGIAVYIAAEMLRGLDHAHELEQNGRRLGIVHRDISPHNVMISWDGAIKLVDFGIAKAVAATGASRAGTIKGKIAYMSPEQARAHEVDGRTDVFAVGVVLHEMLTCERLFRGETDAETLARVLAQPIPRPSELSPGTPADLDVAVMGMLTRDRDARFPSAHAALEALLATSATSLRAGLELEQLLAARFPGEAPRRCETETQKRLPSIPPTSAQPAKGATMSLPSGYAGPTRVDDPMPIASNGPADGSRATSRRAPTSSPRWPRSSASPWRTSSTWTGPPHGSEVGPSERCSSSSRKDRDCRDVSRKDHRGRLSIDRPISAESQLTRARTCTPVAPHDPRCRRISGFAASRRFAVASSPMTRRAKPRTCSWNSGNGTRSIPGA